MGEVDFAQSDLLIFWRRCHEMEEQGQYVSDFLHWFCRSQPLSGCIDGVLEDFPHTLLLTFCRGSSDWKGQVKYDSALAFSLGNNGDC